MLLLPLICLVMCGRYQPEPAKALVTGRYVVLKIAGDLDSEHIAASFSTELDAIKDARLIVVELDGNRSRLDVVAKLGARIKSSPTPVSVLLKDAVDKKVGLGQLLLGVYAKSCFIDPDTEIAATPVDDLRNLAPATISWDSIDRDVSGATWTRLGERSADQALAKALLSPHEDWWAVPGVEEQAWKLSSAAPAGGQSGPAPRQVIWATTTGMTRINLDAQSATGLRLCNSQAKNITPILADAGLSLRSTRTNKSISNGFNEAATSLTRIVEDSKLAVRKVVSTLTIKSTSTRPTPAEDYRKAGKAALDQIDRIQKDLDRADALLSDYPELERRQTPVPKKPVWKAAIEGIRKDLDKHRVTARDFATR